MRAPADIAYQTDLALLNTARDLRFIEQLVQHTPLIVLSKKQNRDFLVIHELHRQQPEMYKSRSHRVDDRIVSIAQPNVRPIVRGKTKANVEFGAKVAISVVDGYAMMERTSWDSFNEGTTLIESVERYVKREIRRSQAKLWVCLIRTRLRQTSETVIALQLLVMNLEKRLRLLFWLLFKNYLGWNLRSKGLPFKSFSRP